MAQTYNQPTGDFVTTILNGALSAGATTATIGTGLNLPSTNGILMVDYDSTAALGATSGPETIIYTTYTSGTGALTGLTRGSAGTTGVAHNNAASVSAAPSILYLNDLYNGNLAAGTSSVGIPAAVIRLEAMASWTPSWTGFSANPAATTVYIQYGKLVFASCHITGSGTSNATAHTITLPVAAKRTQGYALSESRDNGTITTSAGQIYTRTGSNVADLYKDQASAAWTASGASYVEFFITYEAN